MDIKKNIIVGALLLLVVLIYSSAYTVDQREKAIKFKFREIVDSEIEPGLHFRVPFIESVSKFPSRILTLDANTERFLTGEKKYVLVDFFVKWKISDVATYYRATSGGQIAAASSRLEDIMKDGLRNEFSRRTIEEALSEQRDEIMQGLEVKSNEAAKQLGITVVDVRVSKIDFPEQVSESVFERMRSERMRVAQDFRSRGREDAEKIKAAADRESTVILAEAYRDSEKARGQGDAKSAEIYAKAYSQDGDFYSFYRSLDAYRKTLGQQGDMMVLEPDSEFFRYFGNKNATSTNPAGGPGNRNNIVPSMNNAATPNNAVPGPGTAVGNLVVQ
ncbi:MAG: protease modulator HflC [Thiolinea sp.]